MEVYNSNIVGEVMTAVGLYEYHLKQSLQMQGLFFVKE